MVYDFAYCNRIRRMKYIMVFFLSIAFFLSNAFVVFITQSSNVNNCEQFELDKSAEDVASYLERILVVYKSFSQYCVLSIH